MKEFAVTERKGSSTFGVHVVPRSRQNAIVGQYGEALKIRLSASPTKGEANWALRAFLADRLGVPVEAVEILSGHTSRHKVVRVTGVRADRVRALLAGRVEEETEPGHTQRGR